MSSAFLSKPQEFVGIGIACFLLYTKTWFRRSHLYILGFKCVITYNWIKFVTSASRHMDSQTKNEQTKLHAACKAGDTAQVELLLQNGADINLRSSETAWTPLRWTAQCGSSDCTRLLLQWGADLHEVDNMQQTPLHWAAEHGFADMLQVLLDAGANANACDKDISTPLHIVATNDMGFERGTNWQPPNVYRARRDYLRCMRALLRHGVDVNASDKEGMVPLLLAAENSNIDGILLLLQSGANLMHTNVRGENLLHIVCRRANLEAIEFVLATGAFDLQCLSGDGTTPLHLAANCFNEKHCVEIVTTLVQHGADVRARDKYGRTPLHVSASRLKCVGVDTLMRLGADAAVCDDKGKTPLHLAAFRLLEFLSVEILTTLVQRGAGVGARDECGRTPLHLAAWSGSSKGVVELMRLGADAGARDQFGCTPLHLAANHGKLEVVDVLLSLGADPAARDHESKTPMHCALASRKCMRVLLRYHAPVDAGDAQGRTPLHYAAAKLHLRKSAVMLLGAGANRFASDNERRTPIEIAAAAYPDIETFFWTWALF